MCVCMGHLLEHGFVVGVVGLTRMSSAEPATMYISIYNYTFIYIYI